MPRKDPFGGATISTEATQRAGSELKQHLAQELFSTLSLRVLQLWEKQRCFLSTLEGSPSPNPMATPDTGHINTEITICNPIGSHSRSSAQVQLPANLSHQDLSRLLEQTEAHQLPTSKSPSPSWSEELYVPVSTYKAGGFFFYTLK